MKYLDLKQINAPYEHAADEVLQSGWYLKGEATRSFEQHYAEYIGTRHCIGCGNGLDALTLIFRAYKEQGIMHEGDEVIVPANTYIASILAITENRLTPVLIEPDINTLQIDDRHFTVPRQSQLLTAHVHHQSKPFPVLGMTKDRTRIIAAPGILGRDLIFLFDVGIYFLTQYYIPLM